MAKKTSQKRVLFRHIPKWLGLGLLLVLSTFLTVAHTPSQHVAAATNSNLNFQARLMTAGGGIVPDGNYNIEFKLYNAATSGTSSQGSCTGDANCLWTETRTSGNVVTVKNGYLTVNLGSVTALPSIDWSQQLWLTLRVGGTGAPSWDPEMSPRLQLTATPYAFKAGDSATLGGLSSSGFIQNTASPQAGANFNIAGNGAIGGNLSVTGNASYIKPTSNSITAFQIQPASSGTSVFDVDTTNSRVGIGTNAPGATLDIVGTAAADAINTRITNNATNGFSELSLRTDAGTYTLGTGGSTSLAPDIFYLQDSIVGAARLLIDGSGNVAIGSSAPGYKLDVQGGDINTSGVYRVGGTSGSTTTCSGGQFLQNAVIVGGITTGGTCAAGGGGSGVTTVGAFSGSSQANGASISTNTITFGPADGTNPGMVTTGTQTLAGDKTLTGATALSSTANSSVSLTVNATTGTTAVGAIINQAKTADTLQINTTNTTATQTNGILYNRNGAGGTTTNGINITNTAGTLTNGLSFTGSIGTDINRGSGTLSINGASGVNLKNAGTTIAAVSSTGLNVTGSVNASNTLQTSGLDRIDAGGNILNIGNITAIGTYNTNTFTGSALTFGSASAAAIQSATSQALNITGKAASTFKTTAGNLTLQADSGTLNLNSVSTTGGTAVKSVTSNSTGAFQVQNSSGTAVLNVDTTNSRVQLTTLDAISGAGSPGAITKVGRVNATSGGASSFGTGAYTAGSAFTPSAGTVLVAVVNATDDCSTGGLDATASQLTISGGGLTWVAINGVSSPSAVTCNAGARSFYAVVGGSPSSTTISVDAGALTIYNYNVQVDEYTNVDTTTPIAGGVTGSRSSADNDTFTATLGATPVSGDWKYGYSTLKGQDPGGFGNSGYDTPAGWTALGVQQPSFGSSSQQIYQTGSTSTTVNFDLNDLQNATENTSYGGFIIKQSTTVQSNLTIGGSVASNVIVKPSSTFQVQNSSGAAIFSVDAAANAIKLGGSIQGDTVTDARAVSSSATYTESTPALGYFLSSNSGTTNSNITSTFNITGLPEADGTLAFISLRAIKGVTGGSRTSTAIVNINGNYVSTTASATGTGADTSIQNYSVMRLNGVWRIIGYNNTDSDTADLAEWIHYTGDQPTEGDLLSVGDDTTAASTKKSIGLNDNTLIGVVTTKPAQVFGNNNDQHSVRIALTGRVPVKVSLENGAIEPGDYLTSSSVPGVAMKATQPGKMVGVALVGYNGGGDGTVMTQVQAGYGVPVSSTAGQLQGGVTTAGLTELQSSIQSLTDRISNLQQQVEGLGQNINTSILNAGTLTVAGNAAVLQDLSIGGTAKLHDLEISGHLVTKGDAPSIQLQAAAGSVSDTASYKAQVSMIGNDISGVITVTIGDTPVADDLLKLSFVKAYVTPPQVVLTPVGKGSATLQPYVDYPTATDFMLGVTTAPVAGQTYRFNYQILQ